ncbi:MAG TPA: hypothetical protein VM532_13015 [Burkholderiales bacterium]|nr:hypothetical protein [Burkholderiales bacterium]
MNEDGREYEIKSGVEPKRLKETDLKKIKDDLNAQVKTFGNLKDSGANGNLTASCKRAIVENLLHVAECLSRIPVNDLDQSLRVISRILNPEIVRAQSSMITPHHVPEWLSNPATRRQRSCELIPEGERITILGHLAKACERLEERKMKKELGHFAATIVFHIKKDSLKAEDGSANLYFDLLKCLAKDILPRSIKHHLREGFHIPDVSARRMLDEIPKPEEVLNAIEMLDANYPGTQRNRLWSISRHLDPSIVPEHAAYRYLSEDQQDVIVNQERTDDYNNALDETRNRIDSVCTSLNSSTQSSFQRFISPATHSMSRSSAAPATTASNAETTHSPVNPPEDFPQPPPLYDPVGPVDPHGPPVYPGASSAVQPEARGGNSEGGDGSNNRSGRSRSRSR